ncbi:MAG: cysteine--tRNA ligase [Coriobacteriales bacterium]|nr:cysteine--tRNA ligase [Coriobacteriales bacterium]
MRVYNTLSRRKEEFVPIRPGRVGFYLCGPTVYNYIHIGNARTFLSFDVIRRYLEYVGYEVEYVQNITDIDDKIIERAARQGCTPAALAREYTQSFLDSMRRLGIKEPTLQPKATEEIPAMIALIECLLAGDHAYQVDGDVYFAVRSYKDYGRLSGRKVDELRSGARVQVDERKRDPLDFALWKAAKPGEPAWDSPWGKGRPGWHIECSAMSVKYLGDPFDIHAGGDDLVFPHHENELAQSEACSHAGFANYWLHGGMVTIGSEKMSKSEDNFTLLKDVLCQVSAPALRLLMLQTHYRSPFDYSPERLREANAALERVTSALTNMRWSAASLPTDSIAIVNATGTVSDSVPSDISDSAPLGARMVGSPVPERASVERVGHASQAMPSDARLADLYRPRIATTQPKLDKAAVLLTDDIPGDEAGSVALAQQRFRQAMDDDFNTAQALAAIFELISAGNKLAANLQKVSDAAELERIRTAVIELLGVLGIELEHSDTTGWQGDSQAVLALAAKLLDYTGGDEREALDALLELRALARSDKNWDLADKVRDNLAQYGFIIEDTPQGQRLVSKKNGR